MLPRLPSGRVDYALPITLGGIPGDGNTPCAFTDLPDIGRWVARIIVDPRTLNKMVFAYNTVLTMNQAYDLLEEASGEKVERNYASFFSDLNRRARTMCCTNQVWACRSQRPRS
jgi:nucleoside-diphosphate-sugar epimerase